MAHRQVPQDRGERPSLHQAEIHLVAGIAGIHRRRRDRIGPLDDPAVHEHADRHVLPGLERGRVAIEPHPEVGEVLVLIDAPDERRVVPLVVGRHDTRRRGVHKLGHEQDGTRPGVSRGRAACRTGPGRTSRSGRAREGPARDVTTRRGSISFLQIVSRSLPSLPSTFAQKPSSTAALAATRARRRRPRRCPRSGSRSPAQC